jgi:hypothetical protein
MNKWACNATSGTVAARLDSPLPILGLRAQHLGYVYRLFLSLDSRQITEVELRTPWQTLRVGSDVIRFDDKRRVFRLVSPGTETTPETGAAQSLSSLPSPDTGPDSAA